MQSYIFQQLAEKGRADGIDDQVRQKDTRTWFRTAAQKIKNVNTSRMMREENSNITKIKRTDIGKMVMFFYDPKTKKDLPYYDTFPLIFPLTFYNDGFLGINLHYLPPILRAKLMNALYQTINNRKYDDTTKLKISYDILNSASKYKFFTPCVKRYLWTHVRSHFLVIEPRMWDAALMLPTERFKKDTKQNVWLDSQGMI